MLLIKAEKYPRKQISKQWRAKFKQTLSKTPIKKTNQFKENNINPVIYPAQTFNNRITSIFRN